MSDATLILGCAITARTGPLPRGAFLASPGLLYTQLNGGFGPSIGDADVGLFGKGLGVKMRFVGGELLHGNHH
jgi:hypothetical protein